MKKLSRKGKVHPLTYDDYLAFLPPTILALTVVLSPEDKQVLAYLISCSSHVAAAAAASPVSACGGNKIKSGVVVDHPASFNCSCFRCYMSYWVKWDASPNRQVIHEIIDAFEQGSSSSSSLKKNKKQRRKKSKGSTNYELMNPLRVEKSSSRESSQVFYQGVSVEEEESTGGCGEEVEGGGGELLQADQKSSLRSVVSFLGGIFWSALLI